MAATLAQTEVIERGVIIVLRVAGVLYSSYVEKENLPKAMITGRKRVDWITAARQKGGRDSPTAWKGTFLP